MIVLLALFVALSAGASALTVHMHNASDLMAASPVGPAARTIIFVVDGAGPGDIASAPTPVINDLARRGVTYRNAWVGQLESGGAASNATIATGLFPRRHGILGDQWHGNGRGQIVRPIDAQQVQLGAIDQSMDNGGTTPLAGLLKQRSGRAHTLSVGGTGCASANAAGSWLADYVLCPVRAGNRWRPGWVTGHALPVGLRPGQRLFRAVRTGRQGAPAIEGWNLGEQNDWITSYALWALRRTHPALTIINFPEIAAIAPSLGPADRATAVRRLMTGVDSDIGRIVSELRREGVANRTLFVLTSDAGVADLATRVPASALSQSIVAAGGERTFLDPGQTTLVGLAGELQAEPVAQGIQANRARGLDGLYYKSRNGKHWKYEPQYLDPELSAEFSSAVDYELATMTSAGSADVVTVGAPGTGTVQRVAGGGPYASALGAQWDVQHIPLILAGHGVAPGVVSSSPARLVDIAPTVAAMMGLAPPPTDGVVLADGLQQPPSDTKERQASESARLSRLVNALKARLARQGSS